MLSPKEIDAARGVRAATLTPQQHRNQRAFRTSIDCRLQRLITFSETAEFHSYAEYLYAGLCEGDPKVSAYFPQPFQLRYQGKRYVPDAYVVRAGQRYVVELKPAAEFDDTKRACLQAFFKQHGMTFEVISNEEQVVYEQRALNWLRIIRELVRAQDFNTANQERRLMQDWPPCTALTLGDWVDAGDREDSWLLEIALYRLAHRGWLIPQLDDYDLDWSTAFTPCPDGKTN
jgi:hypothetical protein